MRKKSAFVQTLFFSIFIIWNVLNGICDVSKDILKGFYFDNDFVGGKEIVVGNIVFIK